MPQDAPPITIESENDLVTAPMSGIVGFQYACSVCEYDLKGLELNGSCPECGSSMIDAIRRKRLAFQSKAFLTRLRRGALLGYAGSIGMLLWMGLQVYLFSSSESNADPAGGLGVDPYWVSVGLIFYLLNSC